MVRASVRRAETQWVVSAGPVKVFVCMNGNGHVHVKPSEVNAGVRLDDGVPMLNMASLTPPELEAYSIAFARIAKLIVKERDKR